MQVAIDGPSGAGKGTVARELAKQLAGIYIDTGAMYRCIGLLTYLEGIPDEELLIRQEDVIALLNKANIDFKYMGDDLYVYLNGQDVSQEIRREDIGQRGSKCSTIKGVRKKLVDMQRKMAVKGNVVMEGRDIGSVVLPNAKYKFYLTADINERARRRKKQLEEKGILADFDKVLEEISIRDERDKAREESPLKIAQDAIIVDSTNLNIEEVVNKMLAYMRK